VPKADITLETASAPDGALADLVSLSPAMENVTRAEVVDLILRMQTDNQNSRFWRMLGQSWSLWLFSTD